MVSAQIYPKDYGEILIKREVCLRASLFIIVGNGFLTGVGGMLFRGGGVAGRLSVL